MTINITRWKFALGILAITLIAPATAWATHVFSDVDDTRFYAGPVEWAFDNGITTGKSPTIFDPEGNVTRGESVTFLKRYNDNVVEGLPRPVGYATVLDNGDVVEAHSSGVTDANVTLEFTAAFCFRDLGFEFSSVQASPLYESDPFTTIVKVGFPDLALGFDCGDAVLEIATSVRDVFTAHGFTVVFFA